MLVCRSIARSLQQRQLGAVARLFGLQQRHLLIGDIRLGLHDLRSRHAAGVYERLVGGQLRSRAFQRILSDHELLLRLEQSSIGQDDAGHRVDHRRLQGELIDPLLQFGDLDRVRC